MQGAILAVSLLAVNARPQLVFKDGSFRFALFCDMHFGEAFEKDAKSMEFERTMIKLEKPDLVVVAGDASSSYSAWWATDSLTAQDWFMMRWRNWTTPLDESGTPYAYALGNHDRIKGDAKFTVSEFQYFVPNHWIMQADAQNRLSMTTDGPNEIWGASNYVIPIFNGEATPAFYIWILDSNDNNCLGQGAWGCVYPNQVQWFRAKAAQLRQQDGRVVPGVAIVHIPLPELLDVWNHGQDVRGVKNENVCCSSVNTGLFTAMKEAGNIKAVFSGHDHENDFTGWKDGIMLGYGRKSGYGGYASENPGSRIVELKLDGLNVAWSTYIRLETGECDHQTPVSWLSRCFSVQAYCDGTFMFNRGPILGFIVVNDVILSVCGAVLILSVVGRLVIKRCRQRHQNQMLGQNTRGAQLDMLCTDSDCSVTAEFESA